MFTNNITHTITAQTEEADMIIKIRLNDECKNGHEDFSITGIMYEKGKPKTDKYYLAGGCIHEEILKARPDLKIFVRLHLSDADGIPMHATSNMFYHLKNGFSKTPVTDATFEDEFCEYYRIKPEEFKYLSYAKSETHFFILFTQTDILTNWKQEAIEATQLIEQMTGKRFKSSATRSNLVKPEEKAIAKELENIKNGYYSPAATQERKEKETEKHLLKMTEEAVKKCASIMIELEIKQGLYKLGGERFEKNVIFYNHDHTLKFNWMDNVLTENEIKLIKDCLQLPAGVTYK